MLELFHVVYSADERFDATFRTNILVNSSGTCSYLPPGKSHILVTDTYWLGKKTFLPSQQHLLYEIWKQKQ